MMGVYARKRIKVSAQFSWDKIWSHRVKESLKAVQFSVARSGSQQAYDKTLFIIAHIISGKVISNQVG